MINMDNNQKKPIRILEVFGRMNRGGAESMIMNLYRKMDHSQVQLDFMVHTNEHCLFDDEILQLGGRIYNVPRFNGKNLLTYRKAWRRFFEEHPEHRVVHGHMGSTAAIYLHEANRAGRFTIAHSHSAGFVGCVRDILYMMFSFPTRFVAMQFFGCSTEAGIARYGKRVVHSRKYSNFPNAIDLGRFSFNNDVRKRKRCELGIGDNQLVIIHVGRVTTPKNPKMIFQVFKEIIARNEDAFCLWVGTGELEPEYRKLIETEGLQQRIVMTGVRSDIPHLLMAADAFLFPSLWEGLPVSVIEAQSTGLPCVISDAISKEVKVSNLVEWHSLKETPIVWAKRCLALAEKYRYNRYSPVENIRNAGYDIDYSVKWLSDFYVSKYVK